MSNNLKNSLFELLMITLGCSIYAFSLDFVSVPNSLADGGLSGISLLLHHFWQINLGLSTFLLNIPLLLLAYRTMGMHSLINTLWGTSCLAFFLWFWRLLPIVPPLNLDHDLFLAAVLAGCLSGFGLGIVFRNNGTTGGSDIIARFYQLKFGLSSGKVLLFCDAAVLIVSLSYLDLKHMMYTLIASVILTRVMDTIQQGAYTARGILIISNKNPQIAKMIDLKLGRGLTYLTALGGYHEDNKRIIYLVVEPREVPSVKNLIRKEDPTAFVTILPVNEALGQGFSYARKKRKFFIRK